MLNCSDELFLELVWKHKLQRVLRYLLHDLSNYLTGNLALSELYSEGSQGTDSLYEAIVIIRDNCYKEKDVFFEISKLIHPEVNTPDYVDVKCFLDNLKPIFRQILSPQVQFSLDTKKIVTRVIRFKPEYLRRIFIQLICNAEEAVRDIILPKVSIVCFVEDGNLVCQVQDNGCGFDPESLKNLNLDNPRIQEGYDEHLGLGLYMVKTYLSLMDGSISIQSVENSETIVTLQFPILV